MFFTPLNVVLLGLLIATISFVLGFLFGKRNMCKLLKDYVESIEGDEDEEGVVDEDDSEPWDNDPDFWKKR